MRLIWYVMQTEEGHEETLLKACRSQFSEKLLKDVFIFSYERMLRFSGEWHMKKTPLFPGYLFLETEDTESFEKAVRQFAPVFQMLRTGRDLAQVSEEEVRFLNRFCGEDHLLRMSYGTLHHGEYYLEGGPLVGQESLIGKIDRHKRLALVKMTLAGDEKWIPVGLEIREKAAIQKKLTEESPGKKNPDKKSQAVG